MQIDDCEAPEVYTATVLPEWIDVNAHMNVAWYLLAFDYAIDSLWHDFGLTDDNRSQTGSSTFAVESHIRYLNELVEGESFVVKTRVLAFDDKRLHQFQYLFSADTGKLSATCEWLHLHVDLNVRRVRPWPDSILSAISAHPCTLLETAWPDASGQRIAIDSPTGPKAALRRT